LHDILCRTVTRQLDRATSETASCGEGDSRDGMTACPTGTVPNELQAQEGTMNPDELILISVDDHIAEPATMFDAHVPAKYKDQAPRVVTDDNGIQQWWYGNVKGRNLGLNAVAGKSPEMFNVD